MNHAFALAAGALALYLPSLYLPSAMSQAVDRASHAIDRIAGQRVITLQTRMHWHDGAAIRGDRIRTWQLAVPAGLNLTGSGSRSWSRFTSDVPVYGTSGKERAGRQTVSMRVYFGPDGDLLGDGPPMQMFALALTNELPFIVDAKILQAAMAQSGSPVRCVSGGKWLVYHGWVVQLWHAPQSPEYRCTDVAAALDRWTVRIDDLFSKD